MTNIQEKTIKIPFTKMDYKEVALPFFTKNIAFQFCTLSEKEQIIVNRSSEKPEIEFRGYVSEGSINEDAEISSSEEFDTAFKAAMEFLAEKAGYEIVMRKKQIAVTIHDKIKTV